MTPGNIYEQGLDAVAYDPSRRVSITMEVSVEVDAPPERAWEVTSDPTRLLS